MKHDTGVLTSWNDDRGFGFITDEVGHRTFVHISAFGRLSGRPRVGQVVSFTVGRAPDGRTHATDVSTAGARARTSRPRPAIPIVFAVAAWLFIIFEFAGAPLAFVVYAGMSVLTFAAYAIDKSAARRGAWRISEFALLALGLLGGWPGAIVAQQALRHKTRKQPFGALFWTTVVANLAAFAVISSDLLEGLPRFGLP